MTASKLIRPDPAYRDSYLKALDEYHAEGRFQFEKTAELARDFEKYVADISAENRMPKRPFPNWVEPVPETILWLVKDGVYLGTAAIRHRLNWHLEKWGGNLGFIIRPSARGKGFGRKILLRSLPWAQQSGLDRVLITCPPDDESAKHVIEAAGGVLHDELPATSQFPARLRYWIDLE